VDLDEFIKFSYDTLLHLVRDAHIQNKFVSVIMSGKAHEDEPTAAAATPALLPVSVSR
jgi:hypothetical protein